MQPETPRKQAKPRDSLKRKPEMVAFDALEGPFARTFHRFHPRREISVQNPKPYPWFVGGIHRLARQLDGASRGELIYLFSAPLVVALFLLWGYLGVPLVVQSYGLLATCCYFGLFFVDLVFLDRRLDQDDIRRVKAYTDDKRKARDARLIARTEAKKNRDQVDAAAREALEQGKLKARTAGTATGSPDVATPATAKLALDRLLDPR